MKTEISTAAGFITRLLRTPGGIGDEELRCFSESLQEALRGEEAAARDARPLPFRLLPQCRPRRRDERDGARRPSAAGTAVLSPKRTSVRPSVPSAARQQPPEAPLPGTQVPRIPPPPAAFVSLSPFRGRRPCSPGAASGPPIVGGTLLGVGLSQTAFSDRRDRFLQPSVPSLSAVPCRGWGEMMIWFG